MGKIGQIELKDESQTGGAFLLANNPKKDFNLKLSEEWEAVLRKTEPYVVVRSDSDYNKDDLLSGAHRAALRALDIASVSQFHGLTTQMDDRHHILWWTENNNKYIQITGFYSQSVDGSGTISVGDQSSEPESPDHHESFRYHRLSLASDDPFVAYRNLFLAFESLLSDIQPIEQLGHKEWIIQCLKQFEDNHDENPLSGVGSFGGEKYDTVGDFVREHWRNTRIKIFHSKVHKENLSPANNDDVERVRRRIRELSDLYSNLLSAKFGKSIGSAELNRSAFLSMYEFLDNEASRCAIFPEKPDFEDTDTTLQDTTLDYDLFEIGNSVEETLRKYGTCEIEVTDLECQSIRSFVISEQNSDLMFFPPTPRTDIDVSKLDILRVQVGSQYAPGLRPQIW